MKIIHSKRGFAFTYATGGYAEYTSICAVEYDDGSSVFSILWNDGEIDEREIDGYFSIQSLDDGSIIEF